MDVKIGDGCAFSYYWFNPLTAVLEPEATATGCRFHFEAPGPGPWVLYITDVTGCNTCAGGSGC